MWFFLPIKESDEPRRQKTQELLRAPHIDELGIVDVGDRNDRLFTFRRCHSASLIKGVQRIWQSVPVSMLLMPKGSSKIQIKPTMGS